MNKFIVLFCGMAAVGIADPGTLSLERALELARIHSPGLRAARTELQASEKGLGAAGLWKNPELEFDAEGLGWDNDLFSQGEYTVGVSQEFQLGGKQEKDRVAAQRSVEVFSQALREKERKLAAELRRLFIEVVFLQETQTVRSEQMELAREFVEVAKQRHQAGSRSELGVVQAELAYGEARLLLACCFGDLLAAQERLASLIGVPRTELGTLAAPYYELETLDGVVGVDESHPMLQRLTAEAERIRAGAERAKAQDISNVSLGAGYRHKATDNVNTFVFSASIPLAFHRQGRADHAVEWLRAEAVLVAREEALRRIQAELASLLALYDGAKYQVELMENNLIPAAQRAYELSKAGYDMGRYSWLELIMAQQNRADIQVRYIEFLRNAHLAHAQILQIISK